MYRDKDRSGTISTGIAGMMTEIDRAVRPSVQYLVEAQQSDVSHDDNTGGK
jgi:hypothetical protein